MLTDNRAIPQRLAPARQVGLAPSPLRPSQAGSPTSADTSTAQERVAAPSRRTV